jgi:hypothetical protein
MVSAKGEYGKWIASYLTYLTSGNCYRTNCSGEIDTARFFLMKNLNSIFTKSNLLLVKGLSLFRNNLMAVHSFQENAL